MQQQEHLMSRCKEQCKCLQQIKLLKLLLLIPDTYVINPKKLVSRKWRYSSRVASGASSIHATVSLVAIQWQDLLNSMRY